MANGPKIAGENVGSSANHAHAIGAHNFGRSYYDHLGATGDVRAHYEDLVFKTAGSGGGEVIRARGIASAASVAQGATINAIHATGRIASGASVSGALSAIRATLEDANTSGTQGGTLAALQVDSNIAHDVTVGANTAFIRVTNSGAHTINNLLNIEVAKGSAGAATGLVCTDHANDIAANTFIRIMVNGTAHWILATTTAPAAS